MQEEYITEIEKISNNIVSKVKSMIQNIKDINKSSYSLCLVSIFMISYEEEKKFRTLNLIAQSLYLVEKCVMIIITFCRENYSLRTDGLKLGSSE